MEWWLIYLVNAVINSLIDDRSLSLRNKTWTRVPSMVNLIFIRI